MKEFEDLRTEEVAKLTEEQIQAYIKLGMREDFIRSEVEGCKTTLKSLGID